MKWYLALVIALLIGTLGTQIFDVVRWSPSVETLTKTKFVKAPLQIDELSRGGKSVMRSRLFLLDGQEFVCGIPVRDCDTRFRDFRDGEWVEADLVSIHTPDGGGFAWLAMKMRRANNEGFSNDPTQVVEAWKTDARGMAAILDLALVFFLLAFPALSSSRFKQSLLTTVSPKKFSTMGPRP